MTKFKFVNQCYLTTVAVFASTAAATDEFSWNCYCTDNEPFYCLGGLFDTTWMERLDQIKESENLFYNYDAVRTVVNKSHVQLYGDYKLGLLEEFTSNELSIKKRDNNAFFEKGNVLKKRDVAFHMTKMRELKSSSYHDDRLADSRKLVQARKFADELIEKILKLFSQGETALKVDLEGNRQPLNINMFECYNNIISSFNENCFSIYKSTYFLNHLYKFANICVKELDEKNAKNAIKQVCQEKTKQIRNVHIII